MSRNSTHKGKCTFDRGPASHAINLFDMQAKYADIVTVEEVEGYLATLPDGLFPATATRAATEGVGSPA